MLAKKYLPEYNYQDYENWEGRWELIEGIPYAISPAPNPRHQRINGRLFRFFDEALDTCPDCIVSLAIDWKINPHTVIQPDLLIYCQEIEGQYLEKAPHLVVEILSPSTAHKDRNLKFELYQQQVVTYYLIINPVDDSVEIYHLQDKVYVLAQFLPKTKDDNQFSFDLPDCTAQVDFFKIW